MIGLDQPPKTFIAKGLKLAHDLPPVVIKFTGEDPSDVLDHHSLGAALMNEAQGLWKQVPLIIWPKLFARDRKGRARYTAGQQVHPFKAPG